jgi:hypothetical protein
MQCSENRSANSETIGGGLSAEFCSAEHSRSEHEIRFARSGVEVVGANHDKRIRQTTAVSVNGKSDDNKISPAHLGDHSAAV